VPISAVERAGLSSFNEGAKVSYEETENRGKMSAENLRVGWFLNYPRKKQPSEAALPLIL
jgi:hypothetical protein